MTTFWVLIALVVPFATLMGALVGILGYVKRKRAAVSAPTAPPHPSPRVVARAGDRCPYCHDAVKDLEGVACARCMARHHEACWDEYHQCAACGAVERFRGVERTEGRPPPAQRGKA